MAQSRRDQLQAYRFMQRRVRTALLDADPDTNDAPLSRMGLATYAGVMVAILVLAGAGIYGIVRPGGSTAWKKPGALIVERETSTRYIYLDDVLYQVANFSSAKLLLGDRLAVVSVSRNALGRTRHGGSIGIPGAPDYVPDTAHVTGSAWSVCVAGDLGSSATLSMQFQPGVSAAGARLRPDQGFLLAATGRHYLLWNDHAFLIPSPWLAALRYGNAPTVNVTAEFVATIPRGETLQPVTVARSGSAGPTLRGLGATKVGQVFVDTQNRSIYYLVTASGLVYLTPVQADLQLADPATQRANGSTRARLVDSTALTGIAKLPNRAPEAQQGPKTIPTALAGAPGQQVCAVYASDGAVSVVHGGEPPARSGAAAAGLVRLSTGFGALVGAVPAPGQPVAAVYLVTDSGQKFVIRDDRTRATLGLSSAPVAELPGVVVDEIPGRVVLDPAAALQVAGAGAGPTARPS